MHYLYRGIKPLLFRLDAERAHTLVARLWGALARLPGAERLTRSLRYSDPILETSVAGIHFANPLGLAAGFDKNGHYLCAMAQLGFGFIEVGTVTPRPQAGNPRPRIFRLREDQALINRLGFNNLGAEALANRLRQGTPRLPLGINIGKNRDTPPEYPADDYVSCFRRLAPLATYITVNVSSPNTPGLRALQRAEPLAEILNTLGTERRSLPGPRPPIFVKLSPDETPAGLDAAIAVVRAAGIDGIIATNTTLERPATLRSPLRDEAGGLSGLPLQQRATSVVRHLYRALEGALPIIGVGGINSADSAYQRLLAGADLLQLYSALIYEGPAFVATILRGMAAQLRADGFSTLAQAVGAQAHIASEV